MMVITKEDNNDSPLDEGKQQQKEQQQQQQQQECHREKLGLLSVPSSFNAVEENSGDSVVLESDDTLLIKSSVCRSRNSHHQHYYYMSLIFVAVAATTTIIAISLLWKAKRLRVTKPSSGTSLTPSSTTTSECETRYTFKTSWAEFREMVGGGGNASTDDLALFCGAKYMKNHPNNPCSCGNPTIPLSPTKPAWREKRWKRTHQRNLELVNHYAITHQPLDVIMVGDSITEHWLGTDLGEKRSAYKDHLLVYKNLFRKEHGALVEGLALGIGGDQCKHLLYRLLNGEMADHLQPAVWWVLIGTNDFSNHCNVDAITAGNIEVVETILARSRPNTTTVVISSILPRGKRDLTSKNGDWYALSNVNKRLECYAASKDGVEFFNGTEYFLTTTTDSKDNNNKQFFSTTLNSTLLMPDNVHPSAEGSRIWGRAIVDRLLEIKAVCKNC